MPRSAFRFSLLLAGLGILASSPSRAATVELITRLPPELVVDSNLARGAKLGAVRHFGHSVSANGRHIVARRDLPGPFGRFDPVVEALLYDRLSGTVIVAGTSGGGSFAPHITPNGRFIAHDTYSNTMIFLPVTGSRIFDRITGISTPVAVGGSFFTPGLEMSAEGRFATALASPGAILRQLDRLSGDPFGVDIAAGGGAAQTADGRFVAFGSTLADLDPASTDTNTVSDVFLWSRSTGGKTLVSRSAGTSNAGNRMSTAPELSLDGGTVLFLSEAGDLVPGQVDTATLQAFAFDRGSGATTLASHVPGSAVTPVDAPVTDAEISGNGRFAVWVSAATDGVAGQAGPAVAQVFLTDLATGETVLASRSAASPTTGGNGASTYPNLSGDGRYVSFESTATDLVPGQTDTAGTPDVFLFDRVTGTTWLASRAAGSETTAANGASTEPEVSLDGTTVVFNSLATDLAAGDLNGVADVYAFHRDDDAPGGFFTVPPCRLLDTREAAQGPAMASGDVVVRWLNGRCPLPWTAKALSVNVTAVPSNDGYVVLFPGDLTTPPGNSTLNFRGGRVKANNAVVGLSRDGEATFTTHAAVTGGGTVHLVIDVNGYFE